MGFDTIEINFNPVVGLDPVFGLDIVIGPDLAVGLYPIQQFDWTRSSSLIAGLWL